MTITEDPPDVDDAEEPEPAEKSTRLVTDLPEFEGRKPTGIVTKINGSGERIARAMHLEEEAVLLVQVGVSNVGHRITDGGVHRVHTLKVKDLYEVPGDSGVQLLSRLREQWRLADETRDGKITLPGLEGSVPAGAPLSAIGGTLATPADLADFLGLPTVTPVVVRFVGGAEHRWPDAWDAHNARCAVAPTGQPMALPDLSDSVVVEALLDADSGDLLESAPQAAAAGALLAEAKAWWQERFGIAYDATEPAMVVSAVGDAREQILVMIEALEGDLDETDPEVEAAIADRRAQFDRARQDLAAVDGPPVGIADYDRRTTAVICKLVAGADEATVRAVQAYEGRRDPKPRKTVLTACDGRLAILSGAGAGGGDEAA